MTDKYVMMHGIAELHRYVKQKLQTFISCSENLLMTINL